MEFRAALGGAVLDHVREREHAETLLGPGEVAADRIAVAAVRVGKGEQDGDDPALVPHHRQPQQARRGERGRGGAVQRLHAGFGEHALFPLQPPTCGVEVEQRGERGVGLVRPGESYGNAAQRLGAIAIVNDFAAL